MRPRVFPAENRKRLGTAPRSTSCFNEAAGIPRGKHTSGICPRRSGSRFNEAAGIPRGKLLAIMAYPAQHTASMRPRVFPAEKQPDDADAIRVQHASMRPRVFPAENALNRSASSSSCHSLQ